MNISENLIRIKTAKTDIINSLKNKGVEINDDTLINEIPTIIDNAEIGGGGGDTPSVPTELVPKYDGASVFRIVVPTDNYEFAINLCNDATKATYDVDWGDGVLESGLTTDEQHHTYSKPGTYDVNIYNISKDITLGGSTSISGSSSVTVYFLFNNTNNDYWLGNTYKYQKDNTTITNILLGDKITSINGYAFQNCSSLQSVVIPEGVTTIGSYAFRSCSSLQSIVIPEGVTTIGSNAFDVCYSLTYIDLPSTLTSISSSNFNGSYSTTNPLYYIISRAKTAPTIKSNTFQYSANNGILYIPKDADITTYQSSYWKTNLLDKDWKIEYIEDIPEKVPSTLEFTTVNDKLIKVSSLGKGQLISEEKIDNKYIYNFDDTIYLGEKVLPKSLFTTMKFIGGVELGGGCCYGWTTLQSVVIPEGVTSIGNSVFLDCSSLTSITIPDSVTSISSYAFQGCKSLQSIVIPEGVTSINTNVFNGCSSLQSIVIPEGVTSIKTQSFANCSSLQNITIPDSVTSIEFTAFYQCSSLQSIVIPEGVTFLGDSVFSGCYALHSITCKAMTAPTINSQYTFSNIGTKVPSGTPKVLRVPEGATGYDSGKWKSYVLDKGYTLEYITE